MKCTECDKPILFEDDVKVLVVYADLRSPQEYCKHNPFDENDPAIMAILGSQECIDGWMKKRER